VEPTFVFNNSNTLLVYSQASALLGPADAKIPHPQGFVPQTGETDPALVGRQMSGHFTQP
jgi:hypothetical protein